VSGTALTYVVDCSGKPGFNSPRWSINAGIEQTVPLDHYKLVFSGAARYRSNAVVGFDYLPQQNTGNNITFDASVSFGDDADRWTVSAFIRNITDRNVPSYVQYAGSVGRQVTAIYAPPRTYGGRVAFKF
jgi:iron complex outermembrane receptor protein